MKFLLTLFLILFTLMAAQAQQNAFFFRKLTAADGLGNGGIITIGQDRQGFMWFVTRSGLNRYDGHSIKQYSHMADDSTSIPNQLARSMGIDSNGTFLVGLENGLLEFDEKSDRFLPVPQLEETWINKIIPIDKNNVFLSTLSGLVKYNPRTKKALFYRDQPNKLFQTRVFDMVRKKNTLLLACAQGLLEFDLTTETVRRINLSVLDGSVIAALEIDQKGNLWMATSGEHRLIKVSEGYDTYKTYSQYLESGNTTIDNFTSLIADKQGSIWITAQIDGLLRYDDSSDSFQRFLHDPLKVWTPSTNLHSSIFCDRDGILWVGGNNGVNYFNPDKNLFRIIPVFDKDPDIRNRRVARIATEDKNRKLWFATIDGLVKFDPVTNAYREWNNREGRAPKLHFNSVRSVFCDDDNNIWIATGKGVNKYVQEEDKMLFYTKTDSIINGFFFAIDKDKQGNLWFACRDGDGFYYYNPKQKQFRSIRTFPGLKLFTGNGGRKLFHDSKGRYWLGFNVNGAAMYNPETGRHYHWKSSSKNGNAISGATVIDITEDLNGIIWISTYTGLTSIDPATLKIKNYNHTNGLINNSTSSLAVDELNRLWIGTGNGLMMFDSSRTYFTTFGLQNGLPSTEFPDHPSSLMPNGDIMMPTQNGFIRFAPKEFTKEQKQLSPYFTTLTISGKPRQELLTDKIELNYDENFFTIGFGAINYENATETWYAYKLDGVDEDWKYTQNRFTEYTKLPGGNYNFHIKASVDRTVFEGPERSIQIYIKSEFHKTWWFRVLIALLFITSVYLLYRYRLSQQKKLIDLKGKAQLLQKEKVLMMYESLKQQLNPHFLFNSLTSLSALIESDPKMAGTFLEQMSKIYRYILKNRDSELVSLREELNFVQVYINLQKTRFNEGLLVNIEVSEDELFKQIAPVTLQNLVENALKHNIVDADSPLIIDITSQNGYLLVKNNLQRKSMVETSNKQGLQSLQSLYNYLSKRPVKIEETNNAFIISIPLI